jgi:hypothetical protein
MSYWDDGESEIELCSIVEEEAERIYEKNLALKGLSPTSEIQLYLNTLFDSNDHICICQSPSTYDFKRLDKWKLELGRLLAFNPSNPKTNTRRTSDVAKFRNFLVEFDDISIKEQYEGVVELEFPFSAITYSGNKSLHIILSLDEDLSSESEYYFYSNWIHNILSCYIGKPDNSTKSPSFLTRFPNVLADNGYTAQKVLAINSRVKNQIFYSWLEKYPECRPSSPKNYIDDIPLKPERKNIIELIDWYVYEHLGDSYEKSGKWFSCPICKTEGKAHYGKKLCVSGVNRYVSCTADKDHNKNLLKKIWSLKTGGIQNGNK